MQDTKECYVTGATSWLDKHHDLHGPRRRAAEKWGCWVWLKHDIHMALHGGDTALDRRLKRECQSRFEELYGHEKWMQVFGKSYLEG